MSCFSFLLRMGDISFLCLFSISHWILDVEEIQWRHFILLGSSKKLVIVWKQMINLLEIKTICLLLYGKQQEALFCSITGLPGIEALISQFSQRYKWVENFFFGGVYYMKFVPPIRWWSCKWDLPTYFISAYGPTKCFPYHYIKEYCSFLSKP